MYGWQRNAGGRPVHNEQERASRWKAVAVPAGVSGLSLRERQMVAKLADACRLLDDLYWQQSDVGGLAMYRGTQDATLRRLFSIYGSRWDLLDNDASVVGEAAMPAGRELYPYGLTRAQVETYVAAHPQERAALYDPRAVVRGTPEHLQAVPYHVAYAQWLQPMARDLRDAAKLTGDAAFARYLNLRADALLSDDYYASDVAWLELKDPKIDLILAPYETYLDGLLGVKTSYEAAILLRNEAESRKLALYQREEASMQQALPIPSEFKPAKTGQATPMEVADAPLRAGDLRYGYQAVADNLPNDPRIHAEKGSKKIFFRNFMQTRVESVVLPIAARLMTAEQAREVTAEGYLAATILHEISHGLGPAYASVGGKQTDIREAIGPAYGGLEEAKADVTGIFLAKWLADRKLTNEADLRQTYASYLAGILRTLRFGTGEAHGRAELMEFLYLLENGAIEQTGEGKYRVNLERVPAAVESLAQKLLLFEAHGDRMGVEAWFAKYDALPTALSKALENVRDIPVDVTPEFALEKGVRP